MQKVAQAWLIVTLTNNSSAFYLGLDSFAGELPILLFTLVGGVIADRHDRRRLLLMSQYIQMELAVAEPGSADAAATDDEADDGHRDGTDEEPRGATG